MSKESPQIVFTPILRFFAWEHLPEHLKAISRPFCELAEHMAATCAPSAELSAGLRSEL